MQIAVLLKRSEIVQLREAVSVHIEVLGVALADAQEIEEIGEIEAELDEQRVLFQSLEEILNS